jgi:hypothetical protein
MRGRALAAAFLGLVSVARDAGAQLDPLLYLKKNQPNILVSVDTGNRMQRDVYNDYLDANIYKRMGDAWEPALGITDANTSAVGVGRYRRKFIGLTHRDPGVDNDRFVAQEIAIVGDREAAYATFDARTRLSLARLALAEAVTRNTSVARFSLFRTRQSFPRFETPASANAVKWTVNEGPVSINGATAAAALQKVTGDSGGTKWAITRPIVNSVNGAVGGPVAPLVAADAAGANNAVLNILTLPTGDANSLLPAGRDGKNFLDAPVDNMLDDLRAEAQRLIAADPDCANTVAILIVGGGEGASAEDPVAKAKTFLNIGGRRVPIYVIGIAPLTDDDRTELQGIASESGGQFTEITAAMFEAAGTGNPVPELVRALNVAVSHGFASQTDFNKAPDASHPFGFPTEHQVTSPIVGTVNLENAKDIDGDPLPDTIVINPKTEVKVPQRSNVLVTAGYSLPGFDGKLRAFRVYRPEADDTKSTGYKFVADGTPLWVASAPAAASRNIYTALPDGTMLAFAAANAAALQPYLKTADVASAAALIDTIRGLGCSATSCPLGAIVGSTPAIMDSPSLDPPPDSDYPGFVADHKNRRSIIWVGGNDGLLHAIDSRLGKEVWAFIPFNLLPKMKTFQAGQPAGDFRFGMDGSPKVADVKVDGKWRTYLVVGQGSGGTFYQTFDVTLDDIDDTVLPDSDILNNVLSYFSDPASVPLKWAFPSYQHFDVNIGPWGDISAAAPLISKTVGESWSDPAVGQIENATGRFTIITGSGFLKHSIQQQINRNGVVAGTTLYLLDVKDGAVLDSRSVGSDGQAEDVDNCAAAAVNDCRKLKNALQADPVATGPADSRFISKVYTGDLDGRIWRFDVGLDAAGKPVIKQLLKLYTVDNVVGAANEHPVFASMATVNIGATQQYLFVGTGSDLLPQNKVNTQYALLVILDEGPSGARKGMIQLEKTDGLLGDEKVSAFPAVAGDIVFFSTTTYRAGGCAVPDANLYAFTFIGGAAYDTNNDGKISAGGKAGPADSTKVRTTAGARATAPFIVDQHLVFGTGNDIEMFGDPEDFNNGVGQAGVRILSWREVR